MTATTFGRSVIDLLGSAVAAEALFSASLHQGSVPSGDAALAALGSEIATYGPLGCAVSVAGEYGDHPETAAPRMRRVLNALAALNAN